MFVNWIGMYVMIVYEEMNMYNHVWCFNS